MYMYIRLCTQIYINLHSAVRAYKYKHIHMFACEYLCVGMPIFINLNCVQLYIYECINIGI